MDQRLGGLWEGVGHTVAETLTQTGPVLDGSWRAARVSDDLRDVFGFTPGTLVREECEAVDVSVRSRAAELKQQTRQQNAQPHRQT